MALALTTLQKQLQQLSKLLRNRSVAPDGKVFFDGDDFAPVDALVARMVVETMPSLVPARVHGDGCSCILCQPDGWVARVDAQLHAGPCSCILCQPCEYGD
jgi:hypothetical protein